MLTYPNKIDNDNYYHYQLKDVVMSFSLSLARPIIVTGLLLLLLLAAALSLLIGAKSLPFSAVMDAFTGSCQTADCTCWMPVCPVPWPDCWLAARWALLAR